MAEAFFSHVEEREKRSDEDEPARKKTKTEATCEEDGCCFSLKLLNGDHSPCNIMVINEGGFRWKWMGESECIGGRGESTNPDDVSGSTNASAGHDAVKTETSSASTVTPPSGTTVVSVSDTEHGGDLSSSNIERIRKWMLDAEEEQSGQGEPMWGSGALGYVQPLEPIPAGQPVIKAQGCVCPPEPATLGQPPSRNEDPPEPISDGQGLSNVVARMHPPEPLSDGELGQDEESDGEGVMRNSRHRDLLRRGRAMIRRLTRLSEDTREAISTTKEEAGERIRTLDEVFVEMGALKTCLSMLQDKLGLVSRDIGGARSDISYLCCRLGDIIMAKMLIHQMMRELEEQQ